MNRYNNLLRPIVEFRQAFFTILIAIAAFYLQALMLFTPIIGQSLTVILLVSAAWSIKDGFRLYKYHRSLSSSVPYSMSSDQLYKSDDVYFLGKGFEWTPEHTKRINDLYDRENLDFLYANKFEKKIKNWALVNKKRYIGGMLYLFLSGYHILNPWPPRNKTGNSATHGVGTWEGEEDIYLPLASASHILIIGGTGSGKTSGSMVLMGQDVDAGRPTIGIDPKGGFKFFSSLYDAAARNEVLEKFKIIHLAFPEHSAQYNALGSYHRITEVSTRITEGIDTEEAFKQFAWLKVNYISIALHYLGEQATFTKIKHYITRCDDLVVAYCERYIERNAMDTNKVDALVQEKLKSALDDKSSRTGHSAKAVKLYKAVDQLIQKNLLPNNPELQTILSFVKEDINHERKLIKNIEPILEKLTTGSIAKILVPDYDDLSSSKKIFDWSQLINDNEIVYFGTNALGDITVSSTFIQILLEDLTNYLGSRYQYGRDYGRLSPVEDASGFMDKTVALHIDELSAVKTIAIKNLLARAGELGVKIRAYTQSYADFVTSLGSHENAKAALDSFGSIIMFRVNNEETADILVSRLNTVGIEKEGRMFGYADSSSPETPEDFSSSALQREEGEKIKLISHQNIMSLPTGEAYVVTNGQKVEKIKMPLVTLQKDVAPDSIREMVEVMKRNDLSEVSPSAYSDTWFQTEYPEFAKKKSPLDKSRFDATSGPINGALQEEIAESEVVGGIY